MTYDQAEIQVGDTVVFLDDEKVEYRVTAVIPYRVCIERDGDTQAPRPSEIKIVRRKS